MVGVTQFFAWNDPPRPRKTASSGQTAVGGVGGGQFVEYELARIYVFCITSAALTNPLRGSVVDVHNLGRLGHVGGGATRPQNAM